MTTTATEPIIGISKAGHSDLKHVRCCKPAVPRGLCKSGGPPVEPPGILFFVNSAKACKVCADMWEGHHLTCPRDSGRWPQ